MGEDRAGTAEDPADIVLRASGRATISDAIAWVAESRTRHGDVDDQTLMRALNQLSTEHAVDAALRVNRPGSDGGSFYWIPTPVGSVWWAA